MESSQSEREKLHEYERRRREKLSATDSQSNSKEVDRHLETLLETEILIVFIEDPHQGSLNNKTGEGTGHDA